MGHFPSLIEILFSKKKVMLYVGSLGDGNFGDELVYKATKSLNVSLCIIPIQRHMPILLKMGSFIFWKRIDGVIIGGGTLISSIPVTNNFILKLVNAGKPVFFHGTGVGEIIGANSYWKKIFTTKYFGGVRGPLSVTHVLNNLDTSTKTIGDAAFCLFEGSQYKDVSKKNSILINFGTHLNYPAQIKYRKEVELFAKKYVEKGFRLFFLPMHGIDIILGQNLKKEIPELVVLNIPKEYDEAIAHFKSCNFAIGERLHFNILSLMGGCPFVSINYDKKHIDFLESCDMSNAGFSMEEISLAQLNDFFENKIKLIDWESVDEKLRFFKAKQREEVIEILKTITH